MRLIFLIAFLASCAHNLQNTHFDNQYWHNIVTETENSSLASILEQKNPSLLKQIKSDANDPLLLSFWGESLNFDSGAKNKIITDKIMGEVQDFFKLKSDNHIVHAGITHSYGYLFSNLETPYGYKRKRWIDPEVDMAFNLNDRSLSPDTKEGTLLSNLTYFAGKIAFNNSQNFDQLKNVSSEIKNFNYKNLSVKVLTEKINSPTEIKKILRTHFVKFPNKIINEYLLIYSVEDLVLHTEKLITVFPISKEAYLKTTDPVLLGDERPIQVKYNMYLSAQKDLRLSGLRALN